jgi:hypothetical protein
MIGTAGTREKALWITAGVLVVLLAAGAVLLLRDDSTAPAGDTPAAGGPADVLTASNAHYRTVFVQGRVIAGTARYIDDMAALSATKDPNSAAARFGEWRKSSGVEQDMSYLDAVKQAQALGADPAALGTWREDIATTQRDIGAWVRIVPDYEFGQKEQADLDRAADTVNADFDKLDNDVAAVRAAD